MKTSAPWWRSSGCDVNARLDTDALHGALRARPPLSLLAYADRLLLACIADPLDEKAALLSRGPSIVEHAQALSESGAVFGDLTTLLVVTALFLEEQAPAGDELRITLAPATLASRPHVDKRGEPERSVFFHWQERAQLGKSFTIGTPPDQDMAALYHHAHVVFFAARYGAAPVPRAQGQAALIKAYAALARLAEPNADCLAEVLLANECLRPVDLGLRQELTAALAALQDSDGTLAMPDDADPEARHHALVVVALARALAGDD